MARAAQRTSAHATLATPMPQIARYVSNLHHQHAYTNYSGSPQTTCMHAHPAPHDHLRCRCKELQYCWIVTDMLSMHMNLPQTISFLVWPLTYTSHRLSFRRTIIFLTLSPSYFLFLPLPSRHVPLGNGDLEQSFLGEHGACFSGVRQRWTLRPQIWHVQVL